MKNKMYKYTVALCFSMLSILATAAEVEKGDTIYTDDGVPIQFGAKFISESVGVLSAIPAMDAPVVRSWQPGDPIKEIPKRHWRDLRSDASPREPINPVHSPIDPLLENQLLNSSGRALEAGPVNQNGQGFSGVNPPDTVGDVGPNYFIQSINAGGGATVVIYNKDGSIETGPFAMDSLGSGNCAGGFGDPIILYDELADRWMISEFSNSGNQLCVYISQTQDPTLSWYAYAFTASNGFPDYPKYGVWPDAYYVGTNESAATLYAMDRANMLNGNPATMQSFNVSALSGFGFQMVTPADLDGATAPPANSPGIFLRHNDDESHNPGGNNPNNDFLEMFEFDVDWVTPGNSSVTGPTPITVSEFDSDLCGLFSFSCIQQSGSGTTLDPLREVTMWRVAYRNFGSHESIVGNLATDVSGSDDSGVRWFELRRSGGAWSLFQEGTIAPDAESRWMGSAAMDATGNIAVGYNRSSSSTFPSLAVSGRITTDPIGTMGAEQTIVAGSSPNGSNRYGDYSSMSIDPADGCTFWFTGEYNPASQWSTRIASYKFTECGGPTFSMNGTNLTQQLCVNPAAIMDTIELDLSAFNGFNEEVTFAFNPALPTGFSSVGFVPPALTPPGSSSVDIVVDNTATNGDNNFQILASSNSVVQSLDVSVFVTNSLPGQSTLTSPADGSTTASNTPTLSWTAAADAVDYTVDVATDSGFSNIVFSDTVVGTNLVMPINLSQDTEYFWRVSANNACGSNPSSSTFSFTTPIQLCFSTPTPIPDNDPNGVSTTFAIANSSEILDLNVSVDISHTWVGDLLISLEHVNSGTTVVLMDRPGRDGSGVGCSSDDVNTMFDDNDVNPVENQCNGTSPAIGPDSQPEEALSAFNGLNANGDWTLFVSDNANLDTGQVNEWCLDLSTSGLPDFSTAIDDAPSVDEDSGVTIIDVLANDTASVNGAAPISVVTQPTNGTVVITNGGDNLSYEPNADYCNDGQPTDDFTYTINGGSVGTVQMTVNCVNDEPSFAAETDVFVSVTDIGNPNAENVACGFVFGPANESAQAVSDFTVSIVSDPQNILTSVDVLNDGSLSSVYSGSQGMATVELALVDNGGTAFGGDDTSVSQQFNIHVQDYIYRGTFEVDVCQ